MATVYGKVEAFAADRLVVDLRYLDLVRAELGSLGVSWAELDSSELLGLALFEVSIPGSFATGLAAADKDFADRARSVRQSAYRAGDSPPELDALLGVLRGRFAARYEGWSPTMGKERSLDLVESSPHIGGEGDPEPFGESNAFSLQPQTPSADRRIRVGVLDTKLYPHPDLAGRYLAESDAFVHPPATSPSGHAVFMAGLVAQQAPNAELIVRAVLDELGTSSSWEVAKKMVGFLHEDLDILNMSFSCVTHDDQPPLTLARAVERLTPAVVLVAAAGNHGNPSPEQQDIGITPKTQSWPAAFDDVVAVGATDGTGRPAAFSPQVPWLALSRKGDDVPSLFLPGDVEIVRRNHHGGGDSHGIKKFGAGYARWNGTSAAAAIVSGEIAAIAEAHRIDARQALKRLR